jgi:microsomal dipeptidase-like Zn-dependent dipeptidase
MFGNLAHGGAFIAGEPWDQNGVMAALAPDFGSSKPLVNSQSGAPQPSATNPGIGNPSCPSYLDCTNQVLFHADHGLLSNETGGGTNDGAASNLGVPLFNGWPLWTSTVHQQVYYKWLERAWLGGLRLMVMLAVSNEALCRNNIKLNTVDCSDSMASIDQQLQAAKDFQTWLDGQYGGPSNQGWINSACQMSDPNCFATQSGGPGPSWFQIVTSPQQAQSVIGQGKLAIVLGIEVDNIFNCHLTDSNGNILNGVHGQEGPNCQLTVNGQPNTYVHDQLQTYYAKGVRHIFPVHDFDNAFGKTATWSDAINAGQLEGEGAWQDVTNCSTVLGEGDYGFSMNAFFDGVVFSIAFDNGSLVGPQPPYPSGGFTPGGCSNGTGTGGSAPITPVGTYLIQQAMNMGFIIDVDHMSIDGFNTTLNIATTPLPTQPPPPYQYPVPYAGISASHVQFFDMYHQYFTAPPGAGRHERMRTYAQLQQIANVGGMIGVMLKDDQQDTANGWCLPQSNCSLFGGKLGILGATGTNFTYNYDSPSFPPPQYGLQQNCLYSTTETAEQYLSGVNSMRTGDGGLVPHVGLGSDFLGIAGHVGPRFGNGACAGHNDQRGTQESAQNRLQYPFTLAGIQFGQQVSGQKTYDFNVDGLAHIGLFPDMIADMERVGVRPDLLQPLFSSAQAYVTMWSKVYKAPTPNVTMSGVPPTAAWQSTFTVTTSNGGTTTSVPTISVSGVCSISGAVVTMNSGTGTCSVTATWAADPNYAAATITQTATAAKIAQTASFFEAPPSAPYKSSFRIEATANTGEAATITASGPCSVSSFYSNPYTTGTVNMTSGTGTCTLTAQWPGDNNWSPATLTQTTIASKIPPNVGFIGGVPATEPYAASFNVSPSTNASTTATITTSGACTNNGTTITMTSGTGYCFPLASWAADSNYTAQSIRGQTLASKVPLTITANNAAMTFGKAIPTFKASYSGFVNNQNQSVLSGSPSLTTTATRFSPPGTYAITAAVGTLASANYSFPTFNSGTLTIDATATVPPSGSACNGAYQGGTFTGNITVTPNQICEIDGGVVNGNVTSTGGVVLLLKGTTVTGSVNISGTATGLDATVPIHVCGATVKGNLTIHTDSSAIKLGGPNCGATSVGGNLHVQSDSGAVKITSTSTSGNLTVQGNTSTVLLSGNTVDKNLQVENNTDAAANSTQVLNNHVSLTLLCSGNTSITGHGNTAKSKQGQCATF